VTADQFVFMAINGVLAPVNAKLLNQAAVRPAQVPIRLGQCFQTRGRPRH